MSLPDISDQELNETIRQSLGDVIQTMLSFDCELAGESLLSPENVEAPDLGGEEMDTIYVGSVGFVGGVNGLIYLYLKSRFARQAASQMTGLEDDELDFEMVSDVCGELTNMLGGGFKNKLADMGYDSALTIPTVLSGDELFISSMGVAKHLRLDFLSKGEELVADLVLAEPVLV